MSQPIDSDLDGNPRIPESWSREDLARELRAERRRRTEEQTKNRQLERDASRYRRLRILGCAVFDTPQWANGNASRFTNLDEIIDADIRLMPSRGENIEPQPIIARNEKGEVIAVSGSRPLTPEESRPRIPGPPDPPKGERPREWG